MSTPNNKSVHDSVVGWIIGIPIVIVFALLLSPFVIYKVTIDLPIQKRRKRKFLKEREGIVILCITNSVRYKFIDESFRAALTAKGVNRITVFDGGVPNNRFDDFIWDDMINRSLGFPQLLRLTTGGIESVSLKEDFNAFFKKEIDVTQLMGSITWKLNNNSWTITQ